MSARIPPWTRRLIAGGEWEDDRPVVLVECRRGHPVVITAGDVRRAS